ncbi:uncharacterized protein LOC109825787 [Asparagus officinalis]|nr:uncharacterized protein LOC109825787 [Asparagus officinalis]
MSYFQLSTDPILCYPPTTCSSSANGFTPETSSQLHFLPRNSYSTTHKENLLDNIDDNFFNHKLGNKKVLGMDQYSDSKEVHAKDGKADNNMKGPTWNFSMDKTCSSLGNEVTSVNSLGYSTEVTNEFGTKQLNFMESIASSSRPKNSLQISSEILDEPNLTVDSPCWKGASMSQKYSFGSEVKDSGKGSQGLNGNGNQLSQLTAISSPERPLLEIEGANAETVVTDATQDKPSSPNLYSEDHIRSLSETRPDLVSAAKSIDTGLLLQAMHSLSEVLLSSSYSGGVEWKECDHELVRSVINNLEAFTSRNRKVSVSKSNDTPKKPTNTSSEEKNQGKKIEKVDIGSNRITEVTMEDLENDIFAKKEENPQVVLYKNLWMQAETALCSMKYELQLARMTLEMEKNDYETEEKDPVQLMKSPVFMTPMHSGTSYSVENDGGKSSEPKQKEQQTSRDDRIEDSVLARLEIIQGRHSNQKTLA